LPIEFAGTKEETSDMTWRQSGMKDPRFVGGLCFEKEPLPRKDKNTYILENDGWKMNFFLERSFFRGHSLMFG